jgi:hypothetical protein
MLEQEVALLDAAGEVIFVPGPSVLLIIFPVRF